MLTHSRIANATLKELNELSEERKQGKHPGWNATLRFRKS